MQEPKKTCSKCSESKLLSEFHKDNHGVYGVRRDCKVCRSISISAARKENPEKFRERDRLKKAKNRNHYLEAQRAWVKKTKDKNPDYYKTRQRQYYLKNKEEILMNAKKYRDSNRHIARSYEAFRREAVKRATPKWVNMGAVKEIYKQALIQTKETGTLFVVDHVIPLTNKLVCGLHVAENLQVLTAEENNRKYNSFRID